MNEPLTTVTQQGTPVEQTPSEEQTVKLWTNRIRLAEKHFEPDFKRMRENMEFAANIQWAGQQSMDPVSDEYIANFITHHINQKVASLYARDPKAISRSRKRLNYTIWDGTVEQQMAAQMALQGAAMSGMMTPQAAQAAALLQDITQGQQFEQLCDRVGKTLEILYGYQCDTQAPSFKFQMKQLVRRVITCGVGYVRLNFVQNWAHVLSSSLTDDSLAYRIKKAKAIMSGIDDDKIQNDDPRVEQLRLLLESVQSSVQQGDMTNIEQRLEFDFPSATGILVDPKCKCLKGFIGADWIVQKFLLPLDTANAYFELRGDKMITTGGEFKQYADDGLEMVKPSQEGKPDDVQRSPIGCFWEVFDLTTKSSFFLCDGWKYYVQAPAPVEPSINRFWPIFSLTFNDIEVEPGQKVHIYPPSDVQLLKPMQKETNRTGQELREHRKVNRPFFYGLKNMVSESNLKKFADHETGEYIELESPLLGANGQQNVVDAIGKWVGTPIDPNVYSRVNINEDVTKVIGSNAQQQGAPIRHVAATPAIIQEQARMSDVNSNVDDLDDLLSELANGSGEMMLRTFTPETVKRIVGRGSAWPDQQREDFLNAVYLDIVASSSGRPNKAVEIANYERIAPVLIQAMQNPALWPIAEEGIKRLDDRLNIEPFYKAMQLQQQMMMLQGAQQGQPQQQGLSQQRRPAPPHQATGQSPVSAQPMPGMAQ
jgi:hypothetical protein